MSRTVDGETEILLGNKHLLGIFFLLAVLFGVSFVAGYMVGHGSFGRSKTADTTAQNGAAPLAGSQTKAINPAGDEAPASTTAAPPAEKPAEAVEEIHAKTEKPRPAADVAETPAEKAPAKSKFEPLPEQAVKPAPRGSHELYVPETGQRFLQVAATTRESAETVADVLNKAGFPTHVAAKPGDEKFFRVLVGPIKDNNDLTAKREALTKKGFTGMIPRTF